MNMEQLLLMWKEEIIEGIIKKVGDWIRDEYYKAKKEAKEEEGECAVDDTKETPPVNYDEEASKDACETSRINK